VGRAATVDDLNAGWELAREIMHFGFIRESPASLDRREYRHLRRANRARHDRAFLPASTVWDEMLRDAVEAQVLSISCKGQSPFCRAFQACIKSLGLPSLVDE
jgi:hypothetical protein